MDFSSLLSGGGLGGISGGTGGYAFPEGSGLSGEPSLVEGQPTNSAPINTNPIQAGGGSGAGGVSAAPASFSGQSAMGGGMGVGAGAVGQAAGAGAAGAGAGGVQPIPQMNTLSGGGSVGAGLADSFKAIGNAIANYKTDKAYGQFQYAADAPSYRIQPVLANFSAPSIR